MSDKRKKSKRKSVKNENNAKYTIKSLSVSLVCALAAFFSIILLTSFIATKKDLSQTLMKTIPFLACALSGFAGGIITAKQLSNNTVMFSTLSAALESIVIGIVLFISVGDIGLKTLFASAVTVLFSVVGAVLKKNRKPKRKI